MTTNATQPISQYVKYGNKIAQNRATSESAVVRYSMIAITLLFLSLFLFVPLVIVFIVLRNGVRSDDVVCTPGRMIQVK